MISLTSPLVQRLDVADRQFLQVLFDTFEVERFP